MAGARVSSPACQVILSTRKSGVIDLTPFLGESGHVMTAKDLYNPKGTWEIVIPDQPWPVSALRGPFINVDSLYGSVAPMDHVLIRMARFRHEYPGQTPPVVMRGFVRGVSREESMGEDGPPGRVLRIYGDDYGCIGELLQFFNLPALMMGQDILPVFRPEQLGLAKQAEIPAKDFIGLFVQWMNKQLDALRKTDENVMPLGYDGQVTAGYVPIARVMYQQGTAWNLMFDQADTPWNELYIEERDNSPVLVYRPTPWKSLQGAFLPNTGQAIDASKVATVPPESDATLKTGVPEYTMLRTATYRRTDAQVYNLFWVKVRVDHMGPQVMLSDALAKAGGGGVSYVQYPEAAADIFGPRLLIQETAQIPRVLTLPHEVTSQGEQTSTQLAIDEWRKLRMQWLADANIDNALMDDGHFVVRGNEKLKIGAYYTIRRGKFTVDHYITGVQHTFVPQREFFTHVDFIRANNFYTRRQSKNAFLLEGRQGVLEQ